MRKMPGTRSKQELAGMVLRRWVPVGIVSLVATLLSLILFRFVADWQRDLFRAEFELRSATNTAYLQRRIDRSEEVVDSIAGFYTGSVEVTAKEFHDFVRGPLSRHGELQALGWVPRVPLAERKSVETSARREGLKDFRITELDRNSNPVEASPREEYFPVYRLEPLQGNEMILGLDFASNPMWRTDLTRARDTGRIIAGAFVRVLHHSLYQREVLMFKPVYGRNGPYETVEDRRKNLKGFAVGIFRIDSLIETALQDTSPLGIDFELRDESAPPGEEVLYAHISRTTRAYQDSGPGIFAGENRGTVTWRSELRLPGRRWSIVTFPAPALWGTYHIIEAWTVLIAGLLFTALLAAYLYVSSRRAHRMHVLADDLGDLNRMLQEEIRVRERAEAALKESELKYRTMFEAAADAVIIARKNVDDVKIVDCNTKTLQLFGWTREDLIGKEPYMLSPAIQPDGRPSREKSEAFMMNTLEGRPQTFEWQHQRADGTLFDAEVSLSTIYFGGEIHIQGILRDITDRKKMEQELIKKEKLESLGILAGGLAHDFNNLLTVILGNLSLARFDGISNENLQELLNDAEKASEKARGLTQQLLTFSKGGAPVTRSAAIGHVIRESATFALRGSNVKCEFQIPDDLYPAEVDEGQISQVIHNLVINADQAMPQGGSIQIHCENFRLEEESTLPLQEGDYIKISVEDQGCGIPAENLHRVFDPYFTTKQKGSGLGLAGSYSIVKRHGGHVVVESETGRGTIFSIYLPASRKELQERRKVSRGLQKGVGRILLMDDEEAVRKVAGEMLTRLGYEVEFAVDGAETIEIYKRMKEKGRPFRAVIMDLTVPGGMGGQEAIRKLREIDASVPAIVSSGYAEDPVMADFREYGFTGVIAKPYNINSLGDMLSRCLHRKPRGEEEISSSA